MDKLIWWILVGIHLTRAIGTQKMIHKSNYLSSSQKKINSILNWLIPFVWGFAIRYMIKEPAVKVMTKADRKRSTSGGDSGGFAAYDSDGGASVGGSDTY